MYIIDIPYLNLEKMAKSAQGFDWLKIYDSKYIIANGNDAVVVEQVDDRFIFSCDQDDFYAVWFYYFCLGDDYFEISESFKDLADAAITDIVNESKGIRLLSRSCNDVVIWEVAKKAGQFATSNYYNICRSLNSTKPVNVSGIGKLDYPIAPKPSLILAGQDELAIRLLPDHCKELLIQYAEWAYEGGNFNDLVNGSDDPAWCSKGLKRAIMLYGFHDLDVSITTDLRDHITNILQADREVWQEYYLQNVSPYSGVFCEWLRYYGGLKNGAN